ncbi:hypothetical protein BJ508DRAFT_241126 [Ascobolus immersus RN42]|uniref:Peptide N-acetyl-beta-D-glucosaminyl asparaginase amidase A N-terminal domain-containing protein n=1 Tax=Ascobolus immersus RN42 TaxID=1160509 RepID=A0A3N4I0A2_ASCIM|nr:hypothetical protein BJ508DRAFT_241126 [Ascobolus immersus RN42]
MTDESKLELGEPLLAEEGGRSEWNSTNDGKRRAKRSTSLLRKLLRGFSVEGVCRFCLLVSLICFFTASVLKPFLGRTTPLHYVEASVDVRDYDLEVMELDVPIRKSDFIDPGRETDTECSQLLVKHVFGWSYGKPYVGPYVPPSCNFTHVYLNVSTTSKGRQFDRLWHLFLDDVEIWRSSTAEPTQSGINFHHTKDMTLFTNLLKKPGKLLMDLGNLLDEKYTGSFDVTMTATYYTPPLASLNVPNPPAYVFPISKRLSEKEQPSHFHLPADRALSSVSFNPKHKAAITLPATTSHVILSLSASGNAEEEFWYQNVPSDLTKTFPDMTLAGHTGHREIQVLINGNLIAAVNPFVNIFTGGINPGLWRPVVSIDTYDVGEVDIDITPFLPRILETFHSGKAANIEIKVVGYNNGHRPSISTDWLVSGRLLVWAHDDPDLLLHSGWMDSTTHTSSLDVTHKLGRKNASLSTTVLSKRTISQSTTLVWGSSTRKPITQRYDYSTSSYVTNINYLTAKGFNQSTSHALNSVTTNTISRPGFAGCEAKFEAITYELLGISSNYTIDSPSQGDFGIDAAVSHLHCFSGWNRPSVADWWLYNSNTFSCTEEGVVVKAPKAPTLQRKTDGTAHYFAPASAGNKPAQMRSSGTAKTTLERGVPVHKEAPARYAREVKTIGLQVVEDEVTSDNMARMSVTDWQASPSAFVDEAFGVEDVLRKARGTRLESVMKIWKERGWWRGVLREWAEGWV